MPQIPQKSGAGDCRLAVLMQTTNLGLQWTSGSGGNKGSFQAPGHFHLRRKASLSDADPHTDTLFSGSGSRGFLVLISALASEARIQQLHGQGT